MRTGSSPLPRRGHKRHRRRKIEQGSGGKDETGESRKSGNWDSDRPIHFGPRKTRNDAKENPDL